MSPSERHHRIIQLIEKDGKVKMEQLEKELNVSGMTIRRDLKQLEKENKIIRIHGGAISANTIITETPYINKSVSRIKEKQAIAEVALNKIFHGAKIIIDSGTTTLELAKKIKWREDLTVITNDVQILNELLDGRVKVICTGGDLQSEVGSLLGSHAEDLIRNINVDIYFVGVHAISLEKGVTSPTLVKSRLKRLMAESANETWVLADSTKFGKNAFAKAFDLDMITGIITDSEYIPYNITEYTKKIILHYV